VFKKALILEHRKAAEAGSDFPAVQSGCLGGFRNTRVAEQPSDALRIAWEDHSLDRLGGPLAGVSGRLTGPRRHFVAAFLAAVLCWTLILFIGLLSGERSGSVEQQGPSSPSWRTRCAPPCERLL
jgi:hypothetical protein